MCFFQYFCFLFFFFCDIRDFPCFFPFLSFSWQSDNEAGRLFGSDFKHCEHSLFFFMSWTYIFTSDPHYKVIYLPKECLRFNIVSLHFGILEFAFTRRKQQQFHSLLKSSWIEIFGYFNAQLAFIITTEPWIVRCGINVLLTSLLDTHFKD